MSSFAVDRGSLGYYMPQHNTGRPILLGTAQTADPLLKYRRKEMGEVCPEIVTLSPRNQERKALTQITLAIRQMLFHMRQADQSFLDFAQSVRLPKRLGVRNVVMTPVDSGEHNFHGQRPELLSG